VVWWFYRQGKHWWVTPRLHYYFIQYIFLTSLIKRTPHPTPPCPVTRPGNPGSPFLLCSVEYSSTLDYGSSFRRRRTARELWIASEQIERSVSRAEGDLAIARLCEAERTERRRVWHDSLETRTAASRWPDGGYSKE
jgi:hypothetical protein